MLVGGAHGSEMEGIVGLVNLIHVMESGYDLLGRSWKSLLDLAEGVRLTILPCLNPDGRARVGLNSYVGESAETYRYWMQGTRRDGTLYSWPAVKEFHPIRDVGFWAAISMMITSTPCMTTSSSIRVPRCDH